MDDSVIELSSFCSTATRHTVTNEESSSERSEVIQADRANGGSKAGRQSPAESSSAASVVDLNSRVQDDAFSSSSSSSSSG
ncbi:hypothetical protein THAOC_32365, partial [Thalassiosira oceanica]